MIWPSLEGEVLVICTYPTVGVPFKEVIGGTCGGICGLYREYVGFGISQIKGSFFEVPI